jgi:hypothetical protein
MRPLAAQYEDTSASRLSTCVGDAMISFWLLSLCFQQEVCHA